MDSANESSSLEHLDFSRFNDLSSFDDHHNYKGLDELLDSTVFDIAYQQPTLEVGSDTQLIDFDNVLSTCPGGTGWDATTVPQVANDSALITGDPPTDPATQPHDMSALTALKDEVAEIRQQLAVVIADTRRHDQRFETLQAWTWRVSKSIRWMYRKVMGSSGDERQDCDDWEDWGEGEEPRHITGLI